MSPSIDEDAKTAGISDETWKRFKEKYTVEQPEFAEIVDQIDDIEAEQRHMASMAQRWFGYYRKCKSKRNNIIDQYNKIALMGKER